MNKFVTPWVITALLWALPLSVGLAQDAEPPEEHGPTLPSADEAIATLQNLLESPMLQALPPEMRNRMALGDEVMEVIDAAERDGRVLSIAVAGRLAQWRAQRREREAIEAAPWQLGPTHIALSPAVVLAIPQNYRALDAAGALKLRQELGVASKKDVAIVEDTREEGGALILVRALDIGHFALEDAVLDEDAILEALERHHDDPFAAVRQAEQGMTSPYLDSPAWRIPPVLDLEAHTLSWSNSVPDGIPASHVVRFGRTWMVDFDVRGADGVGALGRIRELAGGLEFIDGQGYADAVAGDPVARLTLDELISGDPTPRPELYAAGFAASQASHAAEVKSKGGATLMKLVLLLMAATVLAMRVLMGGSKGEDADMESGAPD